jgi:adenylyl-sulfate kinase
MEPETRDLETGCTLWFTGLSGSGKSTLSTMVAGRLRSLGRKVEVLDGDAVRKHLCRDLGFSQPDREENIRRIGFVCELLTRNGIIAIVAAISPYRAGRDSVRTRIANFVEIYMACPLEVLIARDGKGLYQKALAGEILNFTGISAPYEPPLAPEVVVDSSIEAPEQSTLRILSRMRELGLIEADRFLTAATAEHSA